MMNLFFHQLFALITEELRELFRRKRSLIFIFLYILFYAIGFKVIISIQETMFQTMNSVGIDEEFARGMATLKINSFLPDSTFLETYPLPLILFQIMSLLMLPTFTSLVSCDMLSTDIQRKTLRIVLLRSRRMPYYFSKISSHFILYFFIQFITTVALVLYCSLYSTEHSFLTYAFVSFKFLCLFSFFLLNTLALTELVSGLCQKTSSSLLLLNLIWGVFFITAYYPPFSPFCINQIKGLFIPSSQYMVESIFAQCTWAVLFLFLGSMLFSKREI